MNDDLESRIRRAYPTGLIHELDKSALESADRDDRLRRALVRATNECHLVFAQGRYEAHAYHIVITKQEHPLFDVWTSRMGDAEKIEWITANKGPYPVLWLNVSRIADHYHVYYNHWTPRGDTGYLDADCRRLPSETWIQHEQVIRSELAANGFAYLPEHFCRESVSYVRKAEEIPDDDSRWNDDAFEPPLVTADVYDCLFID
jgi:hypothetical protein